MGVDGGGGRFELDPDALAARLAEWQELKRGLESDRDHGEKLLQARSAGDEPASKTMTNLVRRSGEEFLVHNRALIDYVDDHIAALDAALHTYVNGEESAVRAMRGQIR